MGFGSSPHGCRADIWDSFVATFKISNGRIPKQFFAMRIGALDFTLRRAK
jgi:hypothetical protein